MIIKPSISVISSDRVEARIDLDLFCRSYSDAPESLALDGAVAFSPLIKAPCQHKRCLQ